MTQQHYESWRISYQSSESAARAAWKEMIRVHHRVNELEAQLSAIGAGGVEPLRKPASQHAALAAVPMDMRLVPAEFVRGFGNLAHNYSLAAVAPDHYHGVERDAFSAAYKRCGNDLAKLREILTAAPAHPAEGVPAQAVQPSDALIEAVDAWFADNTGLGGCSDKDVAELAAIFATQPAAQGLDSAISEAVLEAVKAINQGNGDGRAYRAALGWIVAHLNQAVARSLAVDPSGKVALPLATALAAQAKQGGV